MYCDGLRAVKPQPISKLCSFLALAVLLIANGAGAQTCPPPISCRPAPVLRRTFTPPDVQGTYLVSVTDAVVDKTTAAFAAMPTAARVAGAWTVGDMDPLEAFGAAGPYDRTKVARLYVGKRARVARGPLVEQGRTVASITLVSPYPDPSLTRLEPGTLIIEFRVPKK